jgi:hypothetical protein
MSASPSNRTAAQHNETGGTHGLDLIFWLLEKGPLGVAAIPAAAGLLGAGLALAIGLVSGVVPGIRAAKLTAVAALKEIG